MRFFVALILSVCVANAYTESPTGTFNTDGSQADVQSAMTAAVDAGDIVVLPSGTFGWTSGVSWLAPVNAVLIGAGTSATGGADQTVITDNVSGGSILINITAAATTGHFRMTGITVESGSGSTPKDNGTVNFESSSDGSQAAYIRIDHCHFNVSSTVNYKAVRLGTAVFGLMDHCILDLYSTNAIYLYNGRGGTGDWMGNYEWSLPTGFGGPDYFYIEDNIINGDIDFGAYTTRIYDGFNAAKVVLRFNDVSQAVLGETHPTGHAPDDRGLRSQEVYGNSVTSSLTFDPNFVMLGIENGTTLCWGNSADNVYKNIFLFNIKRSNNDTYGQTATPNGWGYAGTQFNGTGSNWDGGTALGTDTTYGYPCLDQPGRGQGDLIVGAFPDKLNNATGTLYWPNQALEPVYIWANAGDIVSGWGGNYYANYVGTERIAPNRDYYPQASGVQTSSTSPFNGTSGTGWGTLANRPTTCTAGVAYWATDQGSWNTSSSNPYGVQQNGADGVLYKATATDTWTAYYTPYTYPHPFQTGTPVSNPTLNIGTFTIGP